MPIFAIFTGHTLGRNESVILQIPNTKVFFAVLPRMVGGVSVNRP